MGKYDLWASLAAKRAELKDEIAQGVNLDTMELITKPILNFRQRIIPQVAFYAIQEGWLRDSYIVERY